MSEWIPFLLFFLLIIFLWRVLVLRTSGAGWLAFRGPKADLIGKEGIAHSALRPCGIARIENQRVDVISSGDLIPAGERIMVISVVQGQIVVEKKEV